jgi:hypothetical protein
LADLREPGGEGLVREAARVDAVGLQPGGSELGGGEVVAGKGKADAGSLIAQPPSRAGGRGGAGAAPRPGRESAARVSSSSAWIAGRGQRARARLDLG